MSTIDTSQLDAGTDSPALARPALLAMAQWINADAAGALAAAANNLANAALPRSGGICTGQITLPGGGANKQAICRDDADGAYLAKSGGAADEIYNTGWYRSTGAVGWYSQTWGGGLHMTDATYVRTYGSKAFYCDQSILAGGDITAYSDERNKFDWQRFDPDELVTGLAAIEKCGGFTRVDNGAKSLGIGAQSLQAILPRAVSADPQGGGLLQVAYGNAALVAAHALARYVVALEARIAALEAQP